MEPLWTKCAFNCCSKVCKGTVSSILPLLKWRGCAKLYKRKPHRTTYVQPKYNLWLPSRQIKFLTMPQLTVCRFITIAIHVIITLISHSILVCVSLVWIIYFYAVVTCITMRILITVLLVLVWGQPAVVLFYCFLSFTWTKNVIKSA